jgi:hypothetical protein
MLGGEIMAQEPFLTNPPKRRHSNKGMKRHRILAFESAGGGMFTSSRAKLVRKGIKINPFLRLNRKHRRHHKRNPFGELMMVGANPFRGGDIMARKHHRKASRRHRRNPVRRHRRYHRNPLGTMTALLPMIAAGTAGAVAVRMVPKFVNLTGMMAYGVKAVVVVGGGWAVGKFVSKSAGEGWIIGSAASMITEILKDTLQTPLLAGLGIDLSEESQMLTGYSDIGAYENLQDYELVEA